MKVVHLVTEGDTWWLSNYGFMRFFFRYRKSLEAYKSAILDLDPILSNVNAVEILNTIESLSFWTS